ncbi:tetratricopeptide repeat protein [Candidatus Ichthyocystis hellenicum]|uniref:tetratricopeptide repeat protein n=1 Tax=Candidatus Ichthyocystis hellenicum TaxID=1561003 RepID=UPI000B85115C|nr:tetratricopeptide repeat protein [Candidatus Ichthyocystis hellenicum]
MDDVVVQWFEEEKRQLDELSASVELTDDAVEVLYSIALNFWENKQFQKAADTYALIFMARPHNPKYLDAMARCRYDMGDYEKAVVLYSYAGTSGGDPATFLLRAAQCYLMMGDADRSHSMIKYVVEGAKVDPSFVPKDVLPQAVAVLKLLDDEREKLASAKNKGSSARIKEDRKK